MSEFSDCYYAYEDDLNELTGFLKELKRYCLIFPGTARFIPFLVDHGYNGITLDDIVIEKYPKHLLRYHFGEDQALWLNFYHLSKLECEIVIEKTGPSENDTGQIARFMNESKLLTPEMLAEFMALLERLKGPTGVDLNLARNEISRIFDVKLLEWCGCVDLAFNSVTQMKSRFPEGIFLLTSKRGKIEPQKNPEPNEWCPTPNAPLFMYLPVPEGKVDEELLNRHCIHWIEKGDFDNERQFGFWMLNAYDKALPFKYRYLSNRIMNINVGIFKDDWEKELRRTIAGILSVSPKDFDWEPYLSKQKGGVHI